MYEGLILVIVIAVALGLILARLGINPILAYFAAGTIGSYVNISFQNSLFDLAKTLAVNVLAFEIGVSFDRSTLNKYFPRALFILLVEVIFVLNVGLILGSILGLDLLRSFLLSLVGVNTSTALVYKFSEGRLDEEDRKLIVAVTSLEDIVAFLGILLILSTTLSIQSILNITLSSLAIIVIGFLISRALIRPATKYTDDLVILASIGSILVLNLVSDQLTFPVTFGALLLGLSTSIALEDTSRILYVLRPLRDFMLIFFFIYAGSLISFDISVLLVIPISLILVFSKSFSFSLAAWLSGIDFVRAFRCGIYMTSISEIGIIITLLAMGRGIEVGLVYPIALMATIIGVLLASVLIRNEESILRLLIKYEARVPKVNKLFRPNNERRLTISKIFGQIVSIIAIISASLILLQLIHQNTPNLLPLAAPFIMTTVPIVIIPLIYEIYMKISNERNRPLILFITLLLYAYSIIAFEDIVLRYYKPVNNVELIILAAALILAIIFYRRLISLGREIGKIFASK